LPVDGHPVGAPVFDRAGAVRIPALDHDGFAHVQVHAAVGARRGIARPAPAHPVAGEDGGGTDHGRDDHLRMLVTARVGRQRASQATDGQHQQVEGAGQQLGGHQQPGGNPPEG